MPVEVPCPGCGLRLKAPDNMVGKKAKCKKCDTQFRIPGGTDSGESVGEAQMLSVISMPSPFGPGGGDQAPAAAISPSAKPAAPAAASIGTQTPAARPGFGSSKPAMPGLPAATPAAARPASGTVAKPAARPTSGTVPKPAARVEAPAGSTPGTKALASPPAAKKAVEPAAPVPVAAPVVTDEPKSKRKSRDEDEDDERPRAKKKGRDDDDEDDDERPRAKKKGRDDDDDDEDDDRPRSKKKSRDDDDDEDDDRPRSKKKSRDDDDDEDDDRPRSKKKSRDDDDDEDDDRPRSKKKSRDDDDDDDRPRSKKRRDEDDEPARAPVAAPVPSADPFAFDVNAEPEPRGKSSDVAMAPVVGGDPFAFDAGPPAAAPEPVAKKKNRDDDEDEKPRSKKKSRDDDDEDEKPRSKKKSRDDDDEPVPAPAPVMTAGDLFSFDAGAAVEAKSDSKDKGKKRDRDDDEPQSKRKGRDDDDRSNKKDRKKGRDDDEPETERRYVSAKDQKGGAKTLIYAIVLGLGALGILIAAVVVMQKNAAKQREEEAAEKAKKEKEEKDKKDEMINVDPPKDPTKKDPPKKDPNPKDPNPKDPPTKKDPPAKKDPAEPPATMLEMPPTAKLLSFQLLPAKQELQLGPKGSPMLVDAPAAKIRRVFVPENRVTHDVVVVWQSIPGVGGKGEKLTVDIHSGQTGAKVGRFDFDGDGKETKCDLSPDGKSFVAAGLDGKLTMWNLADPARPKVFDGYDPYADRADLKAHGLAGVFFSGQSGNLVTVTTAGAVSLVDPVAKKTIERWSPLKSKLVTNRVTLGKNLATDTARSSIIMAVGGVIYQVESATMKTSWSFEDGGEVGRHLGIAVVGVPGQIAYAFETNVTGRKEKGVLFCLPNQKPTVFRWPDAAGDPTEAVWINKNLAVVGGEKGVVYVTADGKFKALGFAETQVKVMSAANEAGYWYTTPDANPARTLFQQLGGESLMDFLNEANKEGKDPPTAKLNEKGLAH